MSDYYYQAAYVTLNEVITQLSQTQVTDITNPTSTSTTVINAQDANVKNQFVRFIYEVSDRLRGEWDRSFLPFDATVTIYATDDAWCWYRKRGSTYVFELRNHKPSDLLSISSLTLDGTVVNSSNYRLDLSVGYPSNNIIFNSSNITIPTADFDASIAITGTWGWHENPTRMWLASGDTVQDSPLSDSATSLTVSSGDNFEVLQYLKIENEYLLVTAISDNTLTVERGVLGSKAASHVATTAISIYNQTDSVRKEVRRLVIRAFLARNGYVPVVGSQAAGATFDNDEFNLPIPQNWGFGSVG